MSNKNNINFDLVAKHMSEKIAQLSRENATLYALATAANERANELEKQMHELESEDQAND